MQQHFFATPLHPDLDAVVLTRSSTASRAVDLLKWSGSVSQHRQNIMQAAGQTWDHMSRLVAASPEDAAQFTSADDDDDVLKLSACYKAGICICCRSGRELHGFRNAVLRVMKEVFHRSRPDDRQLLVDDRVFLVFKSRPRGVADADAVAELWGLAPRYFHISSMSFSPYLPELQECFECNDDDFYESGAVHGELPLKAPGVHKCCKSTSPNLVYPTNPTLLSS
eukprot:2330347-Pyramimonas_sp.AAC.1